MPYADCDGVVADGAIRSGKTVCMSLSFVTWAMTTFDQMNFAMCGKTIGAFRRNVLTTLKLMLPSRGYSVQDLRSDNMLIISKGGRTNYFYLFGGKDERSQDLIQGITLAGVFFDEVALMPESFVSQATGRCSVDGSKFWFNCNPGNPGHWFKKEWLDKSTGYLTQEQIWEAQEKGESLKNILYLHFKMDDNLSLTEKTKERYRSMYSGVFKDRYIKGLWVAAEGAIYRIFTENPVKYQISRLKPGGKALPKLAYINIGVDFGGNKSAHTFVASGIPADFREVVVLKSEKHPAEGVTPEQLYRLFYKFCQYILSVYGFIDIAYADSAEQTLINGMRTAVRPLGVIVKNSLKNPVNDRIRLTTTLMSCGRWFYIPEECKTLEEALRDAVYDDKSQEDKRLDNGTSDIDTLDAYEYSVEPHMKRLLRVMGVD